MRVFIFLATLPLLASPESFQTFLGNYCLDCHDVDSAKGERNFEDLAFPVADDDALIDYQDILDQLNLGEMPPEKKKQPASELRREIIAWLTEAVADAYKARAPTGGETVLRRLNRREYRNTLRDLFGLHSTSFDPTEGFPGERKVHYLDNQGQALVTSGFLLDRYLRAADQVIEKVLPPLERPALQTWEFNDHFLQQPELDSRHIKIDESLGEQGRLPAKMRLYEHPRSNRHMGGHGPLANFAKGVPVDGFYDITISARALHQSSADLPHQLAIVPGNAKYGDLHLPQNLEPELARFSLKKEGIHDYTARVWLDRGITPRFTFPNGPAVVRSDAIKAGKALFKKAKREDYSTEEAFIEGLTHGKLRQIWIHKVSISGPHYSEWPTPTQRELLGGDSFDPAHNAANIHRFLDRGLRRPAHDEEVEQILAVIADRQSTGASPFDAFQDGLKAALCMPAFLYLDEPTDDGKLSSDAIASRLSYFIWASMPDRELRRADLRDPAERKRQLSRMLADPKSDAFISGFLDSWLTLSSLGETPPDRNTFNAYYDHNLEHAMRRETELFARHILNEGLSIDTFLHADFTFLNRDLAKLYGVKHTFDGFEFQRVNLGKNALRGGLLSQASVLTVTANGVDTSPVVRGVWLLENILGTPPSPPPPDVEPLDPDVRGAKGIRDQLEKHRSHESCADCHARIDPLGFALENFDAIGRYRGRYPRGPKIDAAGVLPNGAEFAGFADFRRLMLADKDKFARALTEKLLSYSLGREIDIGDRPSVDAILAELEGEARSFRALLEGIVSSDLFVLP